MTQFNANFIHSCFNSLLSSSSTSHSHSHSQFPPPISNPNPNPNPSDPLSPPMNPLCCIAPVSLDRADRAGAAHHPKLLAPARPSDPGPDPDPQPAEPAAVAGLLYKWVNYGKGWRSRWFVLRDGVLSYYKARGGADRISLGGGGGGGVVRVIGDGSAARLFCSDLGKPFGEVHLKVSSIRASKSDDKRLSIFTGTKTLHLRCDSREDQSAWIEALLSAKDIFPLTLSSGDFAPSIDFSISTEKLRGRLLQEGLSETTIKECESIMLFELFERQNQLKCLHEKHILLLETLRQLESEKVELETTVVDETKEREGHVGQGNGRLSGDDLLGSEVRGAQGGNEVGPITRSKRQQYEYDDWNADEEREGGQDVKDPFVGVDSDADIEDFYSVISEGSATDSDADNESQGADGETDEDGGIYFDTKDFLSLESLRSASYRSREHAGNGCAGVNYVNGSCFPNMVGDINMSVRTIEYPYVKRREKLPEPKEKERPVGLWSIIKENIGKDLSGVCLPVYFNEPLSSLQKCFEDLEYSYLVDRALEWGKQGNSLMRILHIAAFAVSGYASTEGRQCKPFNPLLGETYEADYPDKGLHFFSEKVSHHPMIVACHCDGRGWKFWGDSNLKGKFWGRSIQLDPIGILTLQFEDGEMFQWSKVTTSIYNIILGKIYCDHYGTMRIRGDGQYSCKLKFKEQSIIDRNPHQVHGFVQDNKTGKKVAMVMGKWDEAMYYVLGDPSTKPKGYDPMSEAILLWEKDKGVSQTRYNLSPFAISLNELTPSLSEKLPPTDSRLRPDQRYLENGEYEMANAEKLRLEQLQRQARKLQEKGWQPQWFKKDREDETYRYTGGYWEAREEGRWHGIPDIFGQSEASPSTERRN